MHLMKSLALTGLCTAFALAFALPAAAQTIKIGVILTYSGPQARASDPMEKGIALYLKEHEKDLPPGVKLDIIRRDDTGANPEVAKRLAQELVTRDHVQFLTGVIWSPNAAAIASIATEAKTPFVIMNASGSAITRMSPYIVRTSFTIWQQAYPLGQWAGKQGWKKAYSAVSDFIPGHDGEAAFSKAFTEAGGTMLGTVRFPLESPDFVPFAQRIKDAAPDVVFVFVPGTNQATQMMKAWTDVGYREAGIKLVSTQDLAADDELRNMGESPEGLVSAGIYSAGLKNPNNQAFVAAWKREYGADAIPQYLAVGAWDGMAAILDVIEETKGKFTGDQAIDVLRHWQNPDSPRGPIAIDPATRDIVQNVYIRRVEKVDGQLVNVDFDTIPAVKDPWKELNPPK
jgi:branched-chain amino acid transport system substrate-binding protein